MRKLFEFSGCNGRVKYLIRNIALTMFPLGAGESLNDLIYSLVVSSVFFIERIKQAIAQSVS
jgi:hypothetical protein